MSEIAKVVSIEDPQAKSGMGKNGKPWSQAKVALDNGKFAWVFNPVGVGYVLESYENNGYTNWRKAKEGAYGNSAPKASPAASSELLELLKDNNRMLKQLVGDVDDDTPDFGEDL